MQAENEYLKRQLYTLKKELEERMNEEKRIAEISMSKETEIKELSQIMKDYES